MSRKFRSYLALMLLLICSFVGLYFVSAPQRAIPKPDADTGSSSEASHDEERPAEEDPEPEKEEDPAGSITLGDPQKSVILDGNTPHEVTMIELNPSHSNQLRLQEIVCNYFSNVSKNYNYNFNEDDVHLFQFVTQEENCPDMMFANVGDDRSVYIKADSFDNLLNEGQLLYAYMRAISSPYAFGIHNSEYDNFEIDSSVFQDILAQIFASRAAELAGYSWPLLEDSGTQLMVKLLDSNTEEMIHLFFNPEKEGFAFEKAMTDENGTDYWIILLKLLNSQSNLDDMVNAMKDCPVFGANLQ